ncbi:hypothetical protein AB4Z51_13425 [Bradyrhizobium sp. 2TAF36]
MTMHNVLRLTCAAAVVAACTQAQAADRRMPIDFIGEWCNPTTFKGETNYTLPSWSEDHTCKEIMSIDQYGFAFNMGGDKEIYCEPENIRTSRDTAQSGTAYLATIVASCYIGTAPSQKTRRTYEFNRYKGNIYIKQK